MATVSIIIPTYNRATLLEQAIRSAREQTFGDCEIIVVDDGSVDETATVVQRFGSDVLYLWQANAGVGMARNAGARAATGTHLLFLDSDDMLQPHAVERLLPLLGSAPSAGMAYGQARMIDERGLVREIRKPPADREPGLAPGVRELEFLLARNYLATDGILLTRAIWERTGGFDPACGSMGEDWDLWARIARCSDVAYLPEPVVTVRHHARSLSSMATERMRETARVTYRHILDGALGDSTVGPALQPHRQRLEAFYLYHMAVLAYAGRDVVAARAALRDAFRCYPSLLSDPAAEGARVLWLKLKLPQPLTDAARALKHTVSRG